MEDREQWLSRYAFKEYAPASDDVKRHGLRSLPVAEALSKRFIKTNPPRLTSMLVIDVDDPEAERRVLSKAWDTEEIPEPNWLLINPWSGHAHVGYWLGTPVATSELASEPALKFLHDMQRKLTKAIGGDVHYSHGTTRSPFMRGNPTRFLRQEPYELKEIASPLKNIKLDSGYHIDAAEGRNVNLFNNVKGRAYSVRRLYSDFYEFQERVFDIAAEFNLRAPGDPLQPSEVQSIAKSIAKWTWKRINPKKFPARQAAVANKRWEKVRQGDLTNEKRLLRLMEVREEVSFLKSRGLTHSEIARATGLTKEQVKSKLRYMRKLAEENQ